MSVHLAARLSLSVFITFFAFGCSVYDPELVSGSGGVSGTSGTGGGGTGGTAGVECVPTGRPENCDAVDDDCVGGLNNGNAAASCTEILNASPRCSSAGVCLLPANGCHPGFYNCDGEPSNGCETCTVCNMPCIEDAGSEDSGAEDANMSIADASADATTDSGTDAAQPCVPTNGGVETCDGVDNDCDGTTDNGSTCPTGCTGHTASTGVYARCSPRAFGAARNECAAAAPGLNMKMVRIDTADENAIVHSIAGTSAVWIGATDADGIATEGAWEWADGVQFWMGATPAMGGMPVGGLYSNWATDSAGQPDNAGSGGGEDCAEMTTTGVWNDITCSNSRVFICERF